MSYIKKLIAMVLTFAMTLSMASIATIQAMQSPIEFNKSKTYAVISKTNNKAIYVHNINWGNNDTKADGDYTKSGKVLPNSIFKSLIYNTSPTFHCNSRAYHTIA